MATLFDAISVDRAKDLNGDGIVDSEYLLNELVDRYGPRLAHLNGVLQVLSQLGNVVDEAEEKE